MPASDQMQRRDRKHRDVATREASSQGRVADEWTLVEFRPARWLLTALTVLAFWLAGPKVGNRRLLALAWQFAPRRLRLIAASVGALVLVVVAGSIAALALMLNQLA